MDHSEEPHSKKAGAQSMDPPRLGPAVGPYHDETLLAELTQEVATRLRVCPSRVAVFQALLRLVRDFDGALLTRLVGWMERDGNTGPVSPRPQKLRNHAE
jgi:hypothetical protein